MFIRAGQILLDKGEVFFKGRMFYGSNLFNTFSSTIVQNKVRVLSIMKIESKYKTLKEIIQQGGKAVVAFSGGVDSSFLARVCVEVWGKKAIAITVRNPAHRDREIKEARKMANLIGVNHIVVDMSAEDRNAFNFNPVDRCYDCKKSIFLCIKDMSANDNIIVDGSNLDDLREERPGMRAIEELGVRMPLIEAGLNKKEIRELSRRLGLLSSEQSSSPCLATRFFAGETITEQKVQMVDQAECYLLNLGFKKPLRVRYRQGMAIIELRRDEIASINMEQMDSIRREFKIIGFSRVLLDLQGHGTADQ